MKLLIAIGVLICLIFFYIIWQYVELKKFGITKYEISSDKIIEEHTFVVLADLHGFSYGEKNKKLLKSIEECKPQFILIAGDMIVSKYPETYKSALSTLEQLIEIAPVYYAMGNHESRVNIEEVAVYPEFLEYYKAVEKLGVIFLQNKNVSLQAGKDRLWIGGLEISLDYYEKGMIVPMEEDYIQQQMQAPAKEEYQILLAHNPAYSPLYAKWGADVTFCGHNHGGLIRVPGIGSLMSPQLTWFPKYNDGCHEIAGKKVIISRGLGTHTFHIRIFNRAELINVRLFPNSLEKSSVN